MAKCVKFRLSLYITLSAVVQVILDPKTSRRIFELAKDQQNELQPEDDEDDEDGTEGKNAAFSQARMTSMEDEEDEEDMGDDVEEEEYAELVCAQYSFVLRSNLGLTRRRKLTQMISTLWTRYYQRVQARERR